MQILGFRGFVPLLPSKDEPALQGYFEVTVDKAALLAADLGVRVQGLALAKTSGH